MSKVRVVAKRMFDGDAEGRLIYAGDIFEVTKERAAELKANDLVRDAPDAEEVIASAQPGEIQSDPGSDVVVEAAEVEAAPPVEGAPASNTARRARR